MGDSSSYLMGCCDCPKDVNCTVVLGNAPIVRRLGRRDQTLTGIKEFPFINLMKLQHISKKTGELKICKKVECTEDKHEIQDLIYKRFMEDINNYLIHRYHAQNDTRLEKN